MVSIITNKGVVCDLPKSFQLDNANYESQDMCGPWSVAELKYAGLPGKGPSGTAQNVDDWAEAEYTKYIGPNVLSNQQGSSIDNMHQFLKDAGLHWWDIAAITPGSTQASDIAHIHAALDAGYPVLVTVNEQSVIRRDGSNPYPWEPKLGPITHVFTVVGHTNDGYLLVDDELNATDNWPDQYREANIECHWACTVQLVGPDLAHPWLKPIPGLDPTAWPQGFDAQNFSAVAPGSQEGGIMIPLGWHDDTHTLTAPNGHKVVLGFRDWVLSHNWDPMDEPLEEEHQASPLEEGYPQADNVGQRQLFHYSMLAYNTARGVYRVGLGNEFLFIFNDRAKIKAEIVPPVPAPLPDPQIAVQLAKFAEIAKIVLSP